MRHRGIRSLHRRLLNFGFFHTDKRNRRNGSGEGRRNARPHLDLLCEPHGPQEKRSNRFEGRIGANKRKGSQWVASPQKTECVLCVSVCFAGVFVCLDCVFECVLGVSGVCFRCVPCVSEMTGGQGCPRSERWTRTERKAGKLPIQQSEEFFIFAFFYVSGW